MQKQTFSFRLATLLMIHAMLALNFAPLRALAVDVQTLPDTVAAVSGFTHAARVTWDDLNAADASVVQVQLWPIPTNSYIDRIAFVMEEPFTNSVIASTNLMLSLGVGGNTNRFFGTNIIDGGSTRILSGTGIQFYSTNLLVPYVMTTSTNYLTATFSDLTASSTVDNYVVGKIRVYWRVVQPSRWRF
jgi:hypothetical protein